MNMRSRILVGLCLTAALAFPALADLTYTQGSGTTIFDFTCFTTKHCSAHVPITSAGVEAFTVGSPGQVTVTNTNANGQTTASGSSPVTLASDKNISATPYPIGATVYTATATGTTGATTATLAGASSVTTYICGFSIRANATAAATGNATVTGVITATLNYTQWTAPLASGVGVVEQIFSPCIPASGTNQSIAVVSAAPGSGGVVSVTAWGYKL
jgi:hypothetical protein